MGGEGAPLKRFAVFALFCLLFAGWLTVTLGNITLGADRTAYTGRFDDVTGLLVNDDVKVSGVTVGKVTGISVDDGGAALVTFTVNDSVDVPEDSTIEVRWRDAFGLRFLYVQPGESDVLAIGDDPELDFGNDQTSAPTSIGTFLHRITPFVKALEPSLQNEVLQALQDSIVGRENEIRELVVDGADLTQALASRDEAIGRTLDNASIILDEYAQRDEDIRALVDSLVDITETLARRNDTLDTAVTSLADLQAEFGTLVEANEDELRLALDALETTATTLSTNSAQLNEVLENSPALIAYHRVSRIGQWFNVRGIGTSGDYEPITSERGAELPAQTHPPRRFEEGQDDEGSNAASMFQAPLQPGGGR